MSLEANVQRLIDIEDIKILKRTYAKHCDDNYNPEKLGPLFAEDAIWDFGDLGYAEGREEIKAFFANSPNLVKFAVHYTVNPIIEIDGDEATGEWLLWQPMVMKGNDQALWLCARYEDTYVRQDGKWLFKHVVIHTRALSPYEAGFGKVLVAELGL